MLGCTSEHYLADRSKFRGQSSEVRDGQPGIFVGMSEVKVFF